MIQITWYRKSSSVIPNLIGDPVWINVSGFSVKPGMTKQRFWLLFSVILNLIGDPVWINVSGFPIKSGMTVACCFLWNKVGDISTPLRFAQYDVVKRWWIAYIRSSCSITSLVLIVRTFEIFGLIYFLNLWFSENTENN